MKEFFEKLEIWIAHSMLFFVKVQDRYQDLKQEYAQKRNSDSK